MRMMVDFENPVEPFNTLVKNGTAGRTIEKVLAEIKPEAVYFCARNGKRGGTLIVDLPDASWIPKIAEHLFLAFEAKVWTISARATRNGSIAHASLIWLAWGAAVPFHVDGDAVNDVRVLSRAR